MAVLGLPVRRDARGDAAQEMTGQVGDADPGEDEEAGVVDDPGQRDGALGRGPADPPVTRGTVPCGGAEHDTGHRAAGAGLHPALEVLADPGLVAEVVMGVEAALQSSPGCPIPREADFLEPKGEQVAEWPGQG